MLFSKIAPYLFVILDGVVISIEIMGFYISFKNSISIKRDERFKFVIFELNLTVELLIYKLIMEDKVPSIITS